MVFLVLSIPIYWINEILLWIGQVPVVASYASLYVKIVWPSILCFFIFQGLAFYASSIKRFEVPAIATLVASLINLFLTYVFCVHWGWGYEGICWAIFWNFTSRLIIAALLIHFNVYIDVSPKIELFSKETIHNLGPLFIICLASCGMTVWTSWAFEALTLMSSYLSPQMTAA